MDANNTPAPVNPTYTRGTRTGRVTSAKLRGGEVLLTSDCPANPQFAANTNAKTGAALRTVVKVEVVAPDFQAGERNRRRRITFTDGTTANAAPAETWQVVTAAKSEKVAKTLKAAKFGMCACCGESTRGGSYLPGHDARHASALVAAVANGKRTAETALAEIPASQAKLVAKVAARLNALPQK